MSISTVVEAVVVAIEMYKKLYKFSFKNKYNVCLVYICPVNGLFTSSRLSRLLYSVYIGTCDTCLKVVLNYTVKSHKYLSESRNSF